jgi:hypothetical protein
MQLILKNIEDFCGVLVADESVDLLSEVVWAVIGGHEN